jgi:hypothetical protein
MARYDISVKNIYLYIYFWRKYCATFSSFLHRYTVWKCKKNPYTINQNHIFFKKLLWSHFWIDLNKFRNCTPKLSELFIFWLFVCSLCLYEWFLFVHNLNRIVNFWDSFLVEIYKKIKVNFYLLCLSYEQIKTTHMNIMSK